jgi:antirestriction protein ArdC
MKSEQIKEVTERATEQLVAALNGGHSEALIGYLKAIGRFHRYSLHNIMLIASQKPDASHVAGFRTWHELGRFVKKGEKGILILAPIIRRKIEREEDKDEVSAVIAGFRAAYVFDVSQTDGEQLPQIGIVQGDPRQSRERLRNFAEAQGISVEYSPDIAPARGVASGGKITLLPSQSPAEETSTLAHEFAHELLHRGPRRSSTSRRIRETEAEATAFVVCQAIGLETGSAASETTLLTALGKFIPADERILLIEDTAEIQLSHENLVRFEARREQNGAPAVSIRDLLRAALRHRPDRLLLGEIRSGEAFDLLQLLNTGHSGTICTIHASSAKQGLERFTSCILQSGVELPYRPVKKNIGDSLNVVVHIERRPGRRFISEVLEINSYDPDSDLFDVCAVYLTPKEHS